MVHGRGSPWKGVQRVVHGPGVSVFNSPQKDVVSKEEQ